MQIEPMTEDEEKELAQLEQDEASRQAAEAVAVKRQHLAALKLAKKLAQDGKHGKPGEGFVVVETSLGENLAIRCPTDIEVDEFEERKDDPGRDALEAFATKVTVAPDTAAVQALIASHAAVAPVIIRAAMSMLSINREAKAKEAAKK